MKQLLLQSIACCAVLLPFSQAQAKTYGDFAPGKTFTYTVDQVISVKAVGFSTAVKAAVPADVPKLRKGQRVKFTIGARGQLTATGLSIPFKSDGGSANVYSKVTVGLVTKADTGEVFKSPQNKPTGVVLNFVRTKYAGFSSTVNTVTYSFK